MCRESESAAGKGYDSLLKDAIDCGVHAALVAIDGVEHTATHNTIVTIGDNGAIERGVIIGVSLRDCPPEVVGLLRELKAAIDRNSQGEG